ncbi:hypothetical protein GQ600_20232 [Phytophthora cactorum]|nr:hypothetical protein GQ600_20232 [Phytophthora cactorum]
MRWRIKAWYIVHINNLIGVLNSLKAEYIRLPTSQSEWDAIADAFYKKRGFPFCGGAINGRLIAIKDPTTLKDGIIAKDNDAYQKVAPGSEFGSASGQQRLLALHHRLKPLSIALIMSPVAEWGAVVVMAAAMA